MPLGPITVSRVAGFLCGPCSEDDCCLYPWPDPNGDATPAGPYYPPEDLPDTIVVIIDGTPTTLTRNVGEYDGYAYGDFSAIGNLVVYAQPITGEWRVEKLATSSFGGHTIEGCLIGGTIGTYVVDGNSVTVSVEDEFEDIYTITYDFTDQAPGTPGDFHAGSVEVTRVSLCRWEGSDEFGSWSVHYADLGAISGSRKFFWIATSPEGSGFASETEKNEYLGDVGPMSTPEGHYDYAFGVDGVSYVLTILVAP